ncbi:MAG: phosphate/phosphite/phosphonate ABC transporter substrate-binding protein [Nitrospirota bacterium]
MGLKLKACFLFFLIFIYACADKEVPKKVSLKKTTSQTLQIPSDVGSLRFGFDLRLGPKEDMRIYIPFLRYLEMNTSNKFKIKFAEKYETTIDLLGKGVIHFAAIGPMSYIQARDRYGVIPLVRGLNSEGKAEYRAAIIVKSGSDIKGIRDIKERSFAFGSRYSTQGHLIPRKMLEDRGITMDDLSYYSFTGSHAEVARVVINGEYDAGGLQDTLAKRLEKDGKVKIISLSKPYPSSLICANKDVHPPILKAVRQVLLQLEPSGKHREILIDWDKTEMPMGFVEAKDSDYEGLRRLAYKYGLIR